MWNILSYKSISVISALTIFCLISPCQNNTLSSINSRNSDSDLQDHGNGPERYSALCMDIKPQHSVDIEQIMGTWYGSEIIKHTPDIPGTFHINSCVVIHISDVTQQMQLSTRNYNYNTYSRSHQQSTQPSDQQQQQQRYQKRQQQQQQTILQEQQYQHNSPVPLWSPKYLRLVWNEKDDNLEYTFNYTEFSPGLWTNYDEQRGSLVALNKYTQFHGTVQVVKAVHDHLVLTFCGSDENSSVYTVVLSRQEQGLNNEELRSIRNLLARRGLSTQTIHKVCSSSAAICRNLSTQGFLLISILYPIAQLVMRKNSLLLL